MEISPEERTLALLLGFELPALTHTYVSIYQPQKNWLIYRSHGKWRSGDLDDFSCKDADYTSIHQALQHFPEDYHAYHQRRQNSGFADGVQ